MYHSKTQIRTRYADTDQMGYVYYGKYAEYYEVARVEALRELGVRYADMEAKHKIMLPVASLQVKYLRPLFYDMMITLETRILELPDSFIKFETKIYNEDQKIVNIGKVNLAFVEVNGKRTSAPSFLLDSLKTYFQ